MSETNNRGESQHIPLEQSVVDRLKPLVEDWQTEVASLLPDLEPPRQIYWFNDTKMLIPGYGIGGFAYASDAISLAFDPEFPDKEVQIKNFKGTYFHENYHRAQGFVYKGSEVKHEELPAVGNAIYEGAATVFELSYTDSDPSWGKYDPETCRSWIEELKQLPLDYDYGQWKFYHPEKNEKHIMYRTGTFVVDTALEQHPELKIEDLATKSWQEILDLSGL